MEAHIYRYILYFNALDFFVQSAAKKGLQLGESDTAHKKFFCHSTKSGLGIVLELWGNLTGRGVCIVRLCNNAEFKGFSTPKFFK